MIYLLNKIFKVSLNIFQHHPQHYDFGYSVKDHHGEQHRHESGDGGHAVKGNYGFSDDRSVHREVDYVADHGGFRASVKTNEPGTANEHPAAVEIDSSAHPYSGAHEVHDGHGHATGGHEYTGYEYGRHGWDGYGDLGHDEYGLTGHNYGGY